MKAKDYSKRLKDNPCDEEMGQIALDFLTEIFTLIDSRHAASDSAICSVFDELNNKWRVFARDFDGIVKPNGFEILVEKKMPDLHKAWMITKRNGGRMPPVRIKPPESGYTDLDEFWNKLFWGGK